MTLPAGYHAERGSGAVVRSILQGTDGLFWLWLGALREQLTALVGIVLLVPTAISMDVRMAGILGLLAVAYVVMNAVVMRKTRSGQANVERYNSAVYGRVGDVISNVTVVQSFARLKLKSDAMRTVMSDLLAAQYPVLTWWGLLTVLQRSAATITMVAVLATGAVLAGRGELTVGEIVVVRRLRRPAHRQARSGDRLRHRRASPRAAAPGLLRALDEAEPSSRSPTREPLPPVTARCATKRQLPVSATEQGVFDLDFHAKPGKTVALVGPTGSGKTTTLSLLQRLRVPGRGRILVDGHDIADVTLASLRQLDRRGVPGRRPVQPLHRRQHRHRPPRRDARRGGGGGASRRSARLHHRASPAATTSSSASAAPRCRAASASASPSRAPSSRTRRSSSSTKPRARSTPQPRRASRGRSTGCARDARPSSSPTACRRSPTPTRSWSSTTAASSSGAASRVGPRHGRLLAHGGRGRLHRAARSRRSLTSANRQRPPLNLYATRPPECAAACRQALAIPAITLLSCKS